VQGKQNAAIATLQQALALNATRLKTNPGAPNIAPSVEDDARFASLKAVPECKELLATNK